MHMFIFSLHFSMDCAMLLPNNNENIALEQDYFEQDSNFYDDTDFMHSSRLVYLLLFRLEFAYI